jgi:16S rRNA (cytidine1402-2'-O)-methyltransferase
MSGILYLVSTPIGNLEDITFRAVNTLKSVDIIAAEDTRQSLKLLNHFDIKKPVWSYHEHNKRESGKNLINNLLEGKNIALVTDAGTPGISDPGEDLVRLAVENEIPVFAVPGAAAFVYSLVVSGLSTTRFIFEGFLPREGRERKEKLEDLKNEQRTIIFYEAPHRIERTLEDFYEYFGDRKLAICRELTKRHEEIIRTTLSEAVNIYKERDPKGEFVIVLEGKSQEELNKEKQEQLEGISIEDHIRMYMEKGMDKKEATKKVAKERGLSKSEVYKYSIEV